MTSSFSFAAPTGPVAPVFTTFAADGSLDCTGQRRFLDFLLGDGAIRALFVRSGMGQMYTFTFDEVRTLAELSVKHAGESAPVLVGASGIWDRDPDRLPDPDRYTDEAIGLSRLAEDFGAAGVVHTVPEAIAPVEGQSHDDVARVYFERLGSAISIPIYIYQPPMTAKAYRVSGSLLADLIQFPNVRGIKLSTSDETYISEIACVGEAPSFTYIQGDETAYFTALKYGAKAVIGQGSALYPGLLAKIQKLYESGDLASSRTLQRTVNDLVRELDNPIEFLKRRATDAGFSVPLNHRKEPRNPYAGEVSPLTQKRYLHFRRQLDATLEGVGILGLQA